MSRKLTEAEKISRKRASALAQLRATLSDDELNEDALRAMGLNEAEIAQMLGEPAIIDAEIVSVEESSGNDSAAANLPAVIERSEQAWSDSGMENQNEQKKREYEPKPGRTADGRSTNAANVADWNASLESNSERRCVATNSKGERCRRYAIMGATVCKTHGGSTRAVQHAARVRVQNASNRLMGKLIEIAFDDNKPAGVQLEAIKDSLNRAGLQPITSVEIGVSKPYEEIYADIGSGSRAESRAARGLEPDPMDLIATEQNPSTPHPAMSSNATNHVDNQHDSESRNESGIQSGQTPQGHSAAPLADETPAPRPSPRRGSDRPRTPRSGPHITGDDAIRLANVVNAQTGALRALPPGRSG